MRESNIAGLYWLLRSLHRNLDEEQMIRRILFAAEIILYHNLNWFYYTIEDYRRMVKRKDSAWNYLNTTMTDNRLERRLIK